MYRFVRVDSAVAELRELFSLCFAEAEGSIAMFRNSYQAGFLSILYAIGSKPLELWEKKGQYTIGCFFPVALTVSPIPRIYLFDLA